MVSSVFVNHLKSRRVEFFKCIFKTFCWDSAFNKKSENINSNDFCFVSECVYMKKLHYFPTVFQKILQHYVVFERYD